MFLLPLYLLLLAAATLGRAAAISARRAGVCNRGKRASVCNGHAELCGRSYGNVTFAGAHDSFAISTDPLALARDQEIDLPTQLSRGIRLLQAQSHMNGGELHFCHTSCLLFDGGTVADYLGKVMTFLDANPNEVLTLLFTNPEGVAVDTVWDPIFQSSGIASLAFIPPSLPVKQSDWPTLGELIDGGKRVVIFMDADSDTSKVPYILPEFDMIWETPFDSTDASFPCRVDRIGGSLAQTDHMSLLNHFLDEEILGSILIPNRGEADTTNDVPSIMANVNGCSSFNAGRNPNFLLFDWVDIGNIVRAMDQLNGLA